MISLPITLEQLGNQRAVRAIPAVLHYDSDDPYAVTINIAQPGMPVSWTMARDLLADGLIRPTGEGDVLVQPCNGALEMSLSGDDIMALVYADALIVRNFLALTYAAVPRGRESDHIDVSAELARILGEAA